jgi:hypothetical protein
MDAAALIASLRSARHAWVELPGQAGAAVRILRPLEADFGRFVSGVTVEHVCAYVDGWRGFTEATIQGAAIGAEDPVEFSADLWAEWVRDRVDCVEVVAKAIGAAITSHLQARKAAAGN